MLMTLTKNVDDAEEKKYRLESDEERYFSPHIDDWGSLRERFQNQQCTGFQNQIAEEIMSI